MSVRLMSSPAPTGLPLSVSAPAAGSVVTTMPARLSAGVSFGSVNPKSEATNVCAVSSTVTTVLSAPAGASFTDATVTVTVAVSCPPLPSSMV